MSVITIFNGIYCRENDIIQKIADKTGFSTVTDDVIIQQAGRTSGFSDSKILGAINGKVSIFNKFTHEQERSIAHLRLAVANALLDDNVAIIGYCGHLIPKEISHVLRICLIADTAFRISQAAKTLKIKENEAAGVIHKSDSNAATWTHTIFGNRDPWAASLYDILIPTDKRNDDDIVTLVSENLSNEVLKPTEASLKAAKDFILAARVEVALSQEGHNVSVNARDGAITLTINRNVLMLRRLEEELKSIVEKVDGVASIETRVGKGFYQTDIYRKVDFEAPAKILLVDDEREFVQTLSERLQMRDIGSAVTYDGASALEMLDDDEPDVMILDLKMPGIDGIEVLKKVKATRPGIEVIILTGQGSEKDEALCMKLGAFAYLQKPVEIDLLSDTLNRAYKKVRQNKKDTK
ncbi:MAG: response regulator [Desulfobacterales bacterium]|nr:response regulator [Desulfobacterales bacterium]